MQLATLRPSSASPMPFDPRPEIFRGIADRLCPPPLGDWVTQSNIILDGRPFTFDRHEYLREPYFEDHPDVTEMKAAQLGLTSKALLRALYGAKFEGYRGI